MNTLEKLDAILDYYRMIDAQEPKTTEEIIQHMNIGIAEYQKLVQKVSFGDISKYDVMEAFLVEERLIFRTPTGKRLLSPKGATFVGFVKDLENKTREFEVQAETQKHLVDLQDNQTRLQTSQTESQKRMEYATWILATGTFFLALEPMWKVLKYLHHLCH